MSADAIVLEEKFDYIFLADVIEHLSDVNEVVRNLNKVSHKDTIIIFSMINSLWEPIFMLAEKLSLKTAEGPHYRMGFKEFKKILEQNNFEIIAKGNRLLVPKKIPLIYQLNNFFYKIPFIKRLGVIEYYVIRSGAKVD